MSVLDTRLLRRGNVLALGTEQGAALITAEGWHTIPEPLASLVRRAVEMENQHE